MIDRRNYSERLRDDLHEEYKRLSGQRVGGWVCIAVLALFFVANAIGIDEPYNRKLATLTGGGMGVCGVWLYFLRGDLTRNLRRSLKNSQDMDQLAREARDE